MYWEENNMVVCQSGHMQETVLDWVPRATEMRPNSLITKTINQLFW